MAALFKNQIIPSPLNLPPSRHLLLAGTGRRCAPVAPNVRAPKGFLRAAALFAVRSFSPPPHPSSRRKVMQRISRVFVKHPRGPLVYRRRASILSLGLPSATVRDGAASLMYSERVRTPSKERTARRASTGRPRIAECGTLSRLATRPEISESIIDGFSAGSTRSLAR